MSRTCVISNPKVMFYETFGKGFLYVIFFICDRLGGLRNVFGWKRKNKFYFYP